MSLSAQSVQEVTAVPLSRAHPPEQAPLDEGRLRRRLVLLLVVVAGAAAVITLVPGLEGVRSRFAHASWEWLLVGVVLKVFSGLAYVVVFRSVFCPRMKWRMSAEIGLAELGANAVVPTGGVGGLALGVWALRRAGMDGARVARRSVSFFFLTSVPNVVGVIVIGLALALHLVSGRAGLDLTLAPAVVAAAAIVLTILGGRWAARGGRRAAAKRGADARLTRALDTLAGGVQESVLMLRRPGRWLIPGLIGYLAFDVMVLWATFNAFGATPPLAIIWIGYLIGELGGLIPVPGGIGGVDVGLVGMLVLYHVPVGAATAAVLAYRAIALWVPAAIGAGAFALLRRSLAREALEISCCEEGGEVEVIGRGRVRVTA
jgi:uncharacterized protein (TIRG00374 family)